MRRPRQGAAQTMTSFGIVAALAVGISLVHCSTPDTPRYGVPNSLQGKVPPVPPIAEGPGGLPCGGKGYIKNEPPCDVKYATDIFPLMKSTGKWRCAEVAQCHGGTIPPKITDNPEETWNLLVKFPGGKATYFNPCSKDKADSGFAQNLAGTAGSQMPKPLGTPSTTTPASADEAAKIDKWIACGAPLN